jgi:hypothetical protein
MTEKARFEYTDADGIRLCVEPDITEDVKRIVIRVGRESVAMPLTDIPQLLDGLEDIEETVRWEAGRG